MATNNTQKTDTTESVTITKKTEGGASKKSLASDPAKTPDTKKPADSPTSTTAKNDDSGNFMSNDEWKDVMDKLLYGGTTLILIFVFLVLVSFVASSLGGRSDNSYSMQTSDDEKTNNLFYTLIVIVIIILIVSGGLRYLFRTSFYTNVSTDGTTKEFDIVIDHKTIPDTHPPPPPAPIPEPVPSNLSQNMSGDQVFNIPGQYFGYEKAKNLCKAYGSRLATYSEIESAYENGAEWCNYGWSDGQMALYPTQEKTYNQLQTIAGHEHDCGRPGINGGYMANPNLQFGANCYGKKPNMGPNEQYLMENTPPYPITKKDIKKDKEVDYLKSRLDELLVSPFNNTRWSRY